MRMVSPLTWRGDSWEGEIALPSWTAFQGGDGRFFAGSCDVARHFACVDGHLDWHVTSSAGPARQGAAACAVEFPGSTFGVPPNGYRNAQLLAARPQPSDQVWLAYVRAGGDWRPGVMGERPRSSCPSRAVGHGHGHGRGHGHGKACGRSH